MKIITELQDLTYLEWAKTRHSSGTAGSFLKAYENKRGKTWYYKLSSYESGRGIVGHECVNEIIADRLLSRMGVPHLQYDLIHAKIRLRNEIVETWLCRSCDFKHADESKVALDVYYEMESEPGESPLAFCCRMGFADYIWEMLTIDFLILNRDRHGANVEVLKNRRTKQIRLAPLFDHGLSMLFACRGEADLKCVDPKVDKRVQCYIGSSSTLENLKLIPAYKRMELPDFDSELKQFLFTDIEQIMGQAWINSVWEFLKERAQMYEDFCNQR